MHALKFIKEVKIEVSKVVWPSLKEVSVMTAFISVVVMIAGVVFLLIDSVSYKLINFCLGIGGS